MSRRVSGLPFTLEQTISSDSMRLNSAVADLAGAMFHAASGGFRHWLEGVGEIGLAPSKQT